MCNNLFSERISNVSKSFIREILKVAIDPDMISFAGGLPNKDLFPVQEVQEAANQRFDLYGKDILQYSSTEGYLPLREYIARRYRDRGIEVEARNILITSGSQQGLDLIGKIFMNKGDEIIIEEPGYLGAIQAFSLYQPSFQTVPLLDDGLELEILANTLDRSSSKLIYLVPNFQNPSGVRYSEENRKAIVKMIAGKDIILVEDDPYGELRYVGEDIVSFKKLRNNNTILLGTFSKLVAPSFRIAWMVADDEIMEKLIVAKQASDLHTNYIGQRIVYQYIINNGLDAHIYKIKDRYNKQRLKMIEAINEYLAKEVSITKVEGGMFLWMTLPEGMDSLKLFDIAITKKVAFVPGLPFYINKESVNTLRLNFSCPDEEMIEVGVKRLAEAIREY
ncbi:aminotransferase-like domain-containing protein [Natronospora cellulosivora (SeqCode)]